MHEVSISHQLQVVPRGLAVGGPEVRARHQTEQPSETGLASSACSVYAIFPPFASPGARHMNSGNFEQHRINFHALELALRSKGGGVVGVSETSAYLEEILLGCVLLFS